MAGLRAEMTAASEQALQLPDFRLAFFTSNETSGDTAARLGKYSVSLSSTFAQGRSTCQAKAQMPAEVASIPERKCVPRPRTGARSAPTNVWLARVSAVFESAPSRFCVFLRASGRIILHSFCAHQGEA